MESWGPVGTDCTTILVQPQKAPARNPGRFNHTARAESVNHDICQAAASENSAAHRWLSMGLCASWPLAMALHLGCWTPNGSDGIQPLEALETGWFNVVGCFWWTLQSFSQESKKCSLYQGWWTFLEGTVVCLCKWYWYRKGCSTVLDAHWCLSVTLQTTSWPNPTIHHNIPYNLLTTQCHQGAW